MRRSASGAGVPIEGAFGTGASVGSSVAIVEQPPSTETALHMTAECLTKERTRVIAVSCYRPTATLLTWQFMLMREPVSLGACAAPRVPFSTILHTFTLIGT